MQFYEMFCSGVDGRGIITTIEYLVNRQCSFSDECFQLAIEMHQFCGRTRFMDLLTSACSSVAPVLLVRQEGPLQLLQLLDVVIDFSGGNENSLTAATL